MKKTLRNILLGTALAGSVALSGCVKQPDFENAKWIETPYNGEIWSGYMGENIPKTVANWDKYQFAVGLHNGQGSYLENYRGRTIKLPDLDGDGSVTSGNTKYRSSQ